MSAVPQTSSDHPPLGSREAAALFAGLARKARLLVAVSGGPDSVALLALLAEWAREPGRPALHAATVDHGLRAASADEAEGVALLCGRLGVPHSILLWEGRKPVAGLQERARAARYGLLAREAERIGGAVLVSAHTQDDQAETLLMRMAHGSGPGGLAAMRERADKGGLMLVRPLLGMPKARLVATAGALGLPFVIDPSNGDRRFERVRWRALMPGLAEEGLSAERLALLARRIARLDEAVALRAQALLPVLLLPAGPAPVLRLQFKALLAEPEEIALRVVALALKEVAGESGAALRLERLEACVETLCEAARNGAPAARTLSGCVVALGSDGVLTLRREGPRRRGVHPATS
ncbi:tRNA lysidine(34) synthetase TilS [Bosea sp. 124]|uniref:tRNA lysidine(34) synthetase TilS n=1 Tax=Bosea sp. 124 TaxID=2135642 RepID=UPI000D408AE6|nr:tRNA lysidine(34) synthetase TilS [Bosea sp. 124]PTM41399.1 tRNA(Ile)-lysidine synthase [Bosea sp. 124]